MAYTPQIVDSIMQFLIAVIDGLARNMPTLIQSVVDLLMSFFSGIVSALGSIDTDALLKGIAGIGLLSGIMVALGALGRTDPLRHGGCAWSGRCHRRAGHCSGGGGRAGADPRPGVAHQRGWSALATTGTPLAALSAASWADL